MPLICSCTLQKGKIKDKEGGESEYTASVTINNVAPTVGPITTAVDPVSVGTSITASTSFTDP
ncbi:MAG: hypothetical protein M8353_08760 [ANME-2 cluster archaeon]|nr:hypothetical protein [ANME-2 cluster archaeon]